MIALTFILAYLVFTFIVLGYARRALVWEAGSVLFLLATTFATGIPWYMDIILWVLIASVILVIRVEPLKDAISDYLYKTVGKTIPSLSKTEEEALNAGDTWVEQDIFRGQPDWNRLEKIAPTLSSEEQSFLDNETKALCDLIDIWSVSQNGDLPEEVWQFMKDKGFMGLVIAKAYGGKGFSAYAHSEVVMKIATHSAVAAVTVMVPNSLGPGELLHLYGTEEQRKHYLPKLACGKDVPCFALTEPGAGSDATAIESDAIVVEKKVGNKKVLGLNITINKRWITLAPIATVIGLAVKLKDPDGLLKGVGHEGITCILIPRDTDKLEIGNRHLPAKQPFMNGTIRGQNIFVPIENIIGGQENAGRGWQMLVECLSIGRSISLPALAAASSSVSYLTSGAYARIRRQFGIEIAQFEGVQEKLAEIAGLTYLINATRLLTLAAVDEKKKPSVASAITKYFNTELSRIVVNHAMDVHAGRTVVDGPRNHLMDLYLGIPISVTVEGANIMSRNLLIFGQGSMACHPYIQQEFYALSGHDKSKFNQVIWQHIQYFIGNLGRAVCSAWTGGLFIKVPDNQLKGAYKKLTRLSYAYAWLADLSLIILGGGLKRKERFSARLADGMSYLYMAMAALRYYQLSADDEAQRLHAKWATDYCFYHAQKSMLALCRNFPSKLIGGLARMLVFPFGQTMRLPSDKLDYKIAMSMANDNEFRDTIKKSVYHAGSQSITVDLFENAIKAIINNKDKYEKIKDLKGFKFERLKVELEKKVKNGVLTQDEMDAIVETENLRWKAIQVDEFDFDEIKTQHYDSIVDRYMS